MTHKEKEHAEIAEEILKLKARNFTKPSILRKLEKYGTNKVRVIFESFGFSRGGDWKREQGNEWESAVEWFLSDKFTMHRYKNAQGKILGKIKNREKTPDIFECFVFADSRYNIHSHFTCSTLQDAKEWVEKNKV